MFLYYVIYTIIEVIVEVIVFTLPCWVLFIVLQLPGVEVYMTSLLESFSETVGVHTIILLLLLDIALFWVVFAFYVFGFFMCPRKKKIYKILTEKINSNNNLKAIYNTAVKKIEELSSKDIFQIALDLNLPSTQDELKWSIFYKFYKPLMQTKEGLALLCVMKETWATNNELKHPYNNVMLMFMDKKKDYLVLGNYPWLLPFEGEIFGRRYKNKKIIS